MDAETKAGTLTGDDFQTPLDSETSLFEHQLLCQLHAVKVQHRDSCDETSDKTLNNTALADISRRATRGEIGDCELPNEGDLQIQSLAQDSDVGNAVELKAADVVNTETDIIMKDDTTEHCFKVFFGAEDDESTSGCLHTHHTLVAESVESVSTGHESDNADYCCQRQLVSASECLECHQATAETNQFDGLSSDLTDLGQCFMVSRDSHCSSDSLQDAFMQFLKKKQVS